MAERQLHNFRELMESDHTRPPVVSLILCN
jgi:hypothetical protein